MEGEGEDPLLEVIPKFEPAYLSNEEQDEQESFEDYDDDEEEAILGIESVYNNDPTDVIYSDDQRAESEDVVPERRSNLRNRLPIKVERNLENQSQRSRRLAQRTDRTETQMQHLRKKNMPNEQNTEEAEDLLLPKKQLVKKNEKRRDDEGRLGEQETIDEKPSQPLKKQFKNLKRTRHLLTISQSAKRARIRRKNETEEQRENRREKERIRKRQVRMNESEDRRNGRLADDRERQNMRRKIQIDEHTSENIPKVHASNSKMKNSFSRIDDVLLDQPLSCVICAKLVPRRYMSLHLRYHSQLKSKPRSSGQQITVESTEFKCSLCDKSFQKEFLLQMHQKQHEPPTYHNCQHCEKKYKDKATLNKHTKISHPEFDPLNKEIILDS